MKVVCRILALCKKKQITGDRVKMEKSAVYVTSDLKVELKEKDNGAVYRCEVTQDALPTPAWVSRTLKVKCTSHSFPFFQTMELYSISGLFFFKVTVTHLHCFLYFPPLSFFFSLTLSPRFSSKGSLGSMYWHNLLFIPLGSSEKKINQSGFTIPRVTGIE